MIDRDFLLAEARQMHLTLTPEMTAKLDRYAALLVSWNEKINLTAITDPKEICDKHFVDSLLLLQAVELAEGARAIDVGCGAGFPSIPCAIADSRVEWTLLDSLQKRVHFLQTVCTELSLCAAPVHMRAEDAGKNPEFREQYDLATARAVANLRDLSEYCLPLVKVGGVFAALTGFDVEDELRQAEHAIQILGGRVEELQKFTLPDGSRRAIVCIRKESPTPAKYPRTAAKMKKQPLL